VLRTGWRGAVVLVGKRGWLLCHPFDLVLLPGLGLQILYRMETADRYRVSSRKMEMELWPWQMSSCWNMALGVKVGPAEEKRRRTREVVVIAQEATTTINAK
jgi:hypothetical protein